MQYINYPHFAGGLQAVLEGLTLTLVLKGLIPEESRKEIEAIINERIAKCKERAAE